MIAAGSVPRPLRTRGHDTGFIRHGGRFQVQGEFEERNKVISEVIDSGDVLLFIDGIIQSLARAARRRWMPPIS